MLFFVTSQTVQKNPIQPVTIRTATVAEIVAVEMTNTATDNAPMYIAVRKAKNRAKKPPAAAKDMRREMTIALKVAARKKSINTSTPVKERRAIVPTEITRRALKGLPR